MKLGDSFEYHAKLRERGDPSLLDEAPDFTPPDCLALVTECFSWCNSRRPWWGMSGHPGRLPTAEIAAWLELNGVEDRWDREFIAFGVNEMDETFVSHLVEKRKAESDRKSVKGPTRLPPPTTPSL